jgi:hypothetical protein
MAKHIVLNVIKVIAGIAAVVFWVVPLRTGTQFLLFSASIVVMLICFSVSSNLDDRNTGYWPQNPTDSPLPSRVTTAQQDQESPQTGAERPDSTKPNPRAYLRQDRITGEQSSSRSQLSQLSRALARLSPVPATSISADFLPGGTCD